LNILGQPTAVTCNYERLAERNSRHTLYTKFRVLMDWTAVWGGFHSTAINFTTYLLDVQETAMRECKMTSHT
jgi:hypothetical protein